MLVAPPQTAYRAYSLGPTWKSVAYTALFGDATLAVYLVMYYTMRERQALRSSLAPKCNILVRQLHGMLRKCLPENKPDNPGFGTSKNPDFRI